MFSTLGPDTLKELAFASREGFRPRTGSSLHGYARLGDLLVAHGFAGPVMDMEYVTLTYTRVDDLLSDLRASGGLSATAGPVGFAPRGGANGWRAL